jgi:trk system potassium uptake protein
MAQISFVEKTAGRWESVWRRLTPPQLFAGSFLLLIFIGTVGLKVLPGLYTGERLNWLDALFTATSAVCVTGLIVVDTATYFTPVGQAFILFLIQLGGLGMFAFSTVIILALGQRLSIRSQTLAENTGGILKDVDYAKLTRDILRFTFIIEGIGALLLYAFWVPDLGVLGAIWPAVFHSISAFCNAGFSTFSDNLIGYQEDGGILFVVMALIVLGGLGFLTLEEMVLWRRGKRIAVPVRRFSLSIHSRIVLATSALLIAGGWILFMALEWNATFQLMPTDVKVVNALFMSVAARTAGFNAIDYALASDSSNFLTILLMAIGGSPGSTAGGIKTTTFALIGLLAWSRLRGNQLVTLSGRSVPEETVQRAVGLAVLAFGLITAAILIFTVSEASGMPGEESDFLAFMFEASSAFNTVGLSMGLTYDLSTTGRWTTILLMFVGRVGPLTFAAALARRVRFSSERFRYAYEDVIVG